MGRIRKNLIYSGLLTGMQYLFPLLVYPYVSRVLGVEAIGLVGFIDSIVTYFILFSMMGISIVGMRAVAQCKNDEQALSSAFFSLLSLNAILTAVALVMMIVATIVVDELRDNWQLMGVGMCKLIFNMFLIEWFWRGLEDFRYITIRSVIIRGAYVVAVFIFVRTNHDILTYYILTMLVVIFTALTNMLKCREFIILRPCHINIKKYANSFFSLGLYMILSNAYITLNTIYLGFVSTDKEVGYYVTSMKIIAILLSLISIITYVVLPRISAMVVMAKSIEEKQKIIRILIKRNFLLVVCFCLPIVIITEIYASRIIMLLSGSGYEGAVLPLRIAMLFFFFAAIEQLIVWQMLIPLGFDKQLTKVNFVACIVAIVFSLLSVNKFGASGSAVVWGISELVIFIGALLVLLRLKSHVVIFHSLIR